MKHSQFLKTISTALNVEEKTVALYARRLREAGQLTTGARGVNAPDMTTHDAAQLIVALFAAKTAQDAPIILKKYKLLNIRPFSDEKLPETSSDFLKLLNLRENASVVDVLSRLLEVMADKGGRKKLSNVVKNHDLNNIVFSINTSAVEVEISLFDKQVNLHFWPFAERVIEMPKVLGVCAWGMQEERHISLDELNFIALVFSGRICGSERGRDLDTKLMHSLKDFDKTKMRILPRQGG